MNVSNGLELGLNKLKSVSKHIDNFDKIYADVNYWNKTKKHTNNSF